jgi:hypothetical protein
VYCTPSLCLVLYSKLVCCTPIYTRLRGSIIHPPYSTNLSLPLSFNSLNSLFIVPSLFSQVLNLLSISEKSSKIKFLEKFWKIIFKFLCQKIERHLGHLRGTHHATSPYGGTAQAWSRRGMVRGALGPPLTSPPSLLSLSQNISTP